MKARHTALLLAALCLLTVVVYLPGLSGDYMFDDMSNLLKNERLQPDTLDFDSLHSAAYSSGSGLFRRPVSMVTFALNRYFFGISPWSHKVTNLVIHILTGIAIFLLCRLLVNNYRVQHNRNLSDRSAFWLPVVVSSLWLVHPLNLTPVLYIVQRMTSLAALFTVCGLCLYTFGRQRMLAGKHGFLHILAGLLVFGGLATLSKETGVLLPLYMLVIEISLFRFRGHTTTASKPVYAFFGVVILVPLCLFLLVMLTRPETLLNYYSRDFTMVERLLTEARVMIFYLKLIVIPSISELGLYHDDIALSRGLLDPPTTLYSILGLAALLAAALVLLKARPLASLGVLWFFAGHSLESTIFQLDIAYEHRNYLADMGIILALCSLAAQPGITRLANIARTAAAVVFLLLFASTTWLRATQWSDNVNHAIYEARHHPDSFQSMYAAARIYARLALAGEADSTDKAYEYLERASELDQVNILTETVRIKISYLLDRPVEQAWFDDIVDKLRKGPIRPTHIDSLYELMSCIGIGCDFPLETMDNIFRVALDNESLEHLPELHAELVNVYGYFTINKTGNFEKGLQLFTRAAELQPKEPQRWLNLASLQIAMENYDAAEQTLERLENTDTHGSVVNEIHELQSSIDIKRAMHNADTEPDTDQAP